MKSGTRATHWNKVYADKAETEVSWFQDRASPSLDLIEEIGPKPSSAIVDVGGGASRLVDALLRAWLTDITVLDISSTALAAARKRLGDKASSVKWITADATEWEPQRLYDVWHDRAAFHFLIDPNDQAAYLERLRSGVKQGGHVIIGTFALDGPEKCSGLPVARQSAQSLSALLGHEFILVDSRRDAHRTPWKTVQDFQFSLYRRAG
ncbi:MAG: class I SAM-dependent methyltransferase [Hyphomicrobiales bacterium]|nr:class I SAM-dependent methyltransferase [Hyphomicrobiales bacterium]